MFLKCSARRKDGKAHRSWSIVESCRYSDGRVAQRHVLYLGEINDSQRQAWEKSIAVFDEGRGDQRQIALFPEARKPDPGGTEALSLRLGQLSLRPIYHQRADRIEAHLFVAFLAYCLSVSLRQQLRRVAGGLTPRAVLEKMATLQMIDVRIPTTDGKELLLIRRTDPNPHPCSGDLWSPRLHFRPKYQKPPLQNRPVAEVGLGENSLVGSGSCLSSFGELVVSQTPA